MNLTNEKLYEEEIIFGLCLKEFRFGHLYKYFFKFFFSDNVLSILNQNSEISSSVSLIVMMFLANLSPMIFNDHLNRLKENVLKDEKSSNLMKSLASGNTDDFVLTFNSVYNELSDNLDCNEKLITLTGDLIDLMFIVKSLNQQIIKSENFMKKLYILSSVLDALNSKIYF